MKRLKDVDWGSAGHHGMRTLGHSLNIARHAAELGEHAGVMGTHAAEFGSRWDAYNDAIRAKALSSAVLYGALTGVLVGGGEYALYQFTGNGDIVKDAVILLASSAVATLTGAGRGAWKAVHHAYSEEKTNYKKRRDNITKSAGSLVSSWRAARHHAGQLGSHLK